MDLGYFLDNLHPLTSGEAVNVLQQKSFSMETRAEESIIEFKLNFNVFLEKSSVIQIDRQ